MECEAWRARSTAFLFLLSLSVTVLQRDKRDVGPKDFGSLYKIGRFVFAHFMAGLEKKKNRALGRRGTCSAVSLAVLACLTLACLANFNAHNCKARVVKRILNECK